MITQQELIYEIAKIREAANSLEIKGEQNASYVVYINRKCTEVTGYVNEIYSEMPDPEEDNGDSIDEEDTNGEQDSRMAKSD